MNRFFLPIQFIQEKQVLFPPDLTHQILNVLRLKVGDLVQVLDNQGNVLDVVLGEASKDGKLTGWIKARTREDSEPQVKIVLFFSLTSREKVEWILQKGTETGVAAFQPFISARSIVQTHKLSDQRILRWQRIIREAAEQSHRGLLPELFSPLTLQICLKRAGKEYDLCLLAWEEAGSEGMDIRSAVSDKGKFIKHTALFVGPEGGFTGEEVTLAESCGCQVVSLGRRILRMETAAILFPALVLYELQRV